jgi:ketosteroid isomerase-like protein
MDDNVRWVHETWDAISRGDLSPLEAVLSPDAQWRAVEDGPWNCTNRAAIVEVMGRNLDNGLSGDVEEALEFGHRLVVAFRPTNPAPGIWPLDNGIRYLVVTLDGDLVTELKGCRDRQFAMDYAAAP